MLLLNANGTVKGNQEIASGTGGGPALTDSDNFGSSASTLGDLDGDGVTDLAVGTSTMEPASFGGEQYHLLFMNSDGTAKGGQNNKKIASGTGGGPNLANAALFGSSAVSLGDLDGDGVTDLAVAARGDAGGAVYVLFLKPPGLVGDYNTTESSTRPTTPRGKTLGSTTDLGANGDNAGIAPVLSIKPIMLCGRRTSARRFQRQVLVVQRRSSTMATNQYQINRSLRRWHCRKTVPFRYLKLRKLST